jgi:hypothetical protein
VHPARLGTSNRAHAHSAISLLAMFPRRLPFGLL